MVLVKEWDTLRLLQTQCLVEVADLLPLFNCFLFRHGDSSTSSAHSHVAEGCHARSLYSACLLRMPQNTDGWMLQENDLNVTLAAGHQLQVG